MEITGKPHIRIMVCFAWQRLSVSCADELKKEVVKITVRLLLFYIQLLFEGLSKDKQALPSLSHLIPVLSWLATATPCSGLNKEREMPSASHWQPKG